MVRSTSSWIESEGWAALESHDIDRPSVLTQSILHSKRRGEDNATEAAMLGIMGETFHLPNEGDTHISTARHLSYVKVLSASSVRVMMLGAEHAATVVGIVRAHRERTLHLVAPPPGVRQCMSSSCYSQPPRFHTSLPHPFSGRKVSLRCQDSSFP